jgi:hypothetical protein
MVLARTGIVDGKLRRGIAKRYQAMVTLWKTQFSHAGMVQAAWIDSHIAEHAKASTEIEFGALQTVSSSYHTDDHGNDI